VEPVRAVANIGQCFIQALLQAVTQFDPDSQQPRSGRVARISCYRGGSAAGTEVCVGDDPLAAIGDAAAPDGTAP